MTYDISFFPQKLSRIDELTFCDHHHLSAEDECYFLGEYSARRGYAHSPTNNLIINFKKPMDRRNTAEWPYKGRAIRKAASAITTALKGVDLDETSFIPVPSSKAKTDPLYDNRIFETLQLAFGGNAHILEVFVARENREAFHNDGARSPQRLTQNMLADWALLEESRPTLVLFDDVVTTGCHFRALSDMIFARRNDLRVIGLFLARRLPESADFDEFFD